mgnify:CR=1 FL=1
MSPTPREIVKVWLAATQSLSLWDDGASLYDLVDRLEAAWQREADADAACAEAAEAKIDALQAEVERFQALVIAARRHARVLRDWDAETNVLPLAPECGDGCNVRCGDGSRPGANEYDHAEAHFLVAVDALHAPPTGAQP